MLRLIVVNAMEVWSVQLFRIHYPRLLFGLIKYHVTNSRAQSCHMIMKSQLAQTSMLLARRVVGVIPLEAASVLLA